ncbi:hypothetical protein ACSX1A_10525 [Pontibacter sp. MBLB2868]|uniref:hypothetical protein n=1 Tax=Pontibacter sp. MBLB2868 TaxID=3451555 RepID=UPI003F74CCCC
MKKTVLITFWLLCNCLVHPAFTIGLQSAKALVDKSLAAMGGEERLRQLQTMRLQAIGHTYFLEQSERPEGPWLVNYHQVAQERDYARQRLYLKKESRNVQQSEWQGNTLLYEDNAVALQVPTGQLVPGRQSQLEEAREVLQFAPEQVLLGAGRAADLHVLRDTVLQGVPHKGIGFTVHDQEVRLFLNVHTYLPTLLQMKRTYPHDLMWAVWGKVRNDMFFSFWSLTAEGILYPLQYNLYRNGQPYQELTIISLELNKEITEETIHIPGAVKKAFAVQPIQRLDELPLGRPDQQLQEIVPGVLLIPGFWNVALIKQDKEVYMLEAPISGGYTAKVLAEAERRYPGLHVKGVISTSDAWPHVAGIQECARRRLPIYALDLNKPFLQRLAAASGKAGQRAKVRPVATQKSIGEGKNRMELYPVRGESGERMMLVYFPEHRLLYASDLVQLNRDGSFFQKAYVAEVVAAVNRYGLRVDQVFAMHTNAMPYVKLKEALAQ